MSGTTQPVLLCRATGMYPSNYCTPQSLARNWCHVNSYPPPSSLMSAPNEDPDVDANMV